MDMSGKNYYKIATQKFYSSPKFSNDDFTEKDTMYTGYFGPK